MFRFIFKKIYYFFSALFLFFLFSIQKLFFIRIGCIYNNKIGHLVGNTQIYLYKKELKKKFNLTNNSLFQIDLWFSSSEETYLIIENFYKKKLLKLPKFFLLGAYNLAFKNSYFRKFIINEHDWGLDFFNLNFKKKSENLLSKNQIIFAENELKKIGVYPKDKLVCFINRNNFYNKNIIKNKSLIKINEYRNSNFDDYLLAAKYLADKGYKIIRLGSHNKNFNNKYVINYSSSKISNLLIDIFLLKKAKLIVSSGTGIDILASQYFKKQICYVNLIPYLGIQSFKFEPKGVFLTKKLDIKGKLLSLKEIYRDNHFNKTGSDLYYKSGIKILNNSKKEILECVKEFYQLNIKNYKYKKKEILLQKKFYKILNNEIYKNSNYEHRLGSHKNLKLSLRQKPLANFSSHFLKNNSWFLKQ
jgi:putative glycosyltransferase (TIGR04372 family)